MGGKTNLFDHSGCQLDGFFGNRLETLERFEELFGSGVLVETLALEEGQ